MGPLFQLLPSCTAAFSQDVGAVAGGTAGTIVQGVESGAAAAYNAIVPGAAPCDSSDFWCNYGSMIVLGGVALAAFLFLMPQQRRARR